MLFQRKKHLDDEEIIRLFEKRDENAIKETDQKYGRLLVSIAMNYLPDPRDVEECVLETYLRVWNAVPPARPENLKHYLTTILENMVISVFRKRNAKRSPDRDSMISLDECGELIGSAQEIDRMIDSKIAKEIIEGYLEHAPIRCQQVFIDRFYLNRTIKETARHLEISVATVKRVIAEMRKELRRQLEEGGVGL